MCVAKATETIANLTPLRGIAALLVVIFHYQIFIRPIFPAPVAAVIDKFYLCVDLFFVLSGFVIAHVYAAKFANGLEGGTLGRFFRARFARIYPLHFVTLLYLVILASIGFSAGLDPTRFPGIFFDFRQIPLQLFLLQATWLTDEPFWNSPSWSISTEWWAYVCFPLLAFALARNGRLFSLAALGLIALGYFWIVTYWQPEFWAARWARIGLDPDIVPYEKGTIDIIAQWAPVRCLCGFVLGMVAWKVWLSGRMGKALRSGWIVAALVLILIAGWAAKLLTDPFAVVLFTIMILALAHNQDWLSRLLNLRPVVHLGDISYSIYLVHMPILYTWMVHRDVTLVNDPLKGPGPGYDLPLGDAWIGFIGFVLLTLFLASLSYRFVECPARDALRAQRPTQKIQSA
jgi:peptidoglycan/LPS O-acetylase OafA/YrhL